MLNFKSSPVNGFGVAYLQIDLRLTWGNEALVPVSKSVACPKLKPGEQGVVSVLLQIPRK